MKKAEIGIIGGSGLYAMPGLTNVREERVTTPFGDPSDAFVLGELEGRKVAFLARHGRGHRLLPTRAELSREHLRDEDAGSGADSFGFGGGLAERGAQAYRLRDAGPVHRPHVCAHFDVLRRRDCGACRLRRSGLRDGVGSVSRRHATPLAWSARAAARMSAWKGRSSRRVRSRIFTAAGAPM